MHTFTHGQRVRVRAEQPRLSRPLFVGRVGTVAEPNSVDPAFLYVELDATPSAKARTEMFHTDHLEPIAMQTGYHELQLDAIAPSPTNPRKTFDPESLQELADSIREHGVVQPIVVRPWPADVPEPNPEATVAGGMYEIIAGERRWRASRLAGVDTIPAIVRDIPTAQVLEIQIIENLQRRDVTELEEADGYRLMIDQYGYDAAQLAEKVGKSKAYIYGRLKLCDLKPAGREAMQQGAITPSVALLVARIPAESLQARAVREVVDLGLTARAAAARIQALYMLRLCNATWPLDAADLTSAGPCIGCPKNTATDRDQYADVDADVCTDPDCWQEKVAANTAAQAAALVEAGHTVISGDKAREWAPNGVAYYIHNGIVPLDEKEYFNDTATRRERISDVLDDSVARTFIEDVKTGKLAECIARETWWALVQQIREAAITPEDKAAAIERDKLTRAAAEAGEAENRAREAYAARLYGVTRAAYTLAHDATPNIANPTLRNIIIGKLNDDLLAESTIQQYNLPDPRAAYGDTHDEAVQTLRAAYRDRLATMQAPELLNLIADNDCDPEGWPSWEWRAHLEGLREYAAAYGLDPDAIRAELQVSEANTAPGSPDREPCSLESPDTEAPKTVSTPEQAAPAHDSIAAESLDPPEAPAAEKQAAPAATSKRAKPKTKASPAPAKSKAPASNTKTSGRASPAGGKEKTTRTPKRTTEAAEVVA